MFKPYDYASFTSDLYSFNPDELNELLGEVSSPDKFLHQWTPFQNSKHYRRVMNELKALHCFGKPYDTLAQDAKDLVEKLTPPNVRYFSIHSELGQAAGEWNKVPPREVYKKLYCGYFDNYSGCVFYIMGSASSIYDELCGRVSERGDVE